MFFVGPVTLHNRLQLACHDKLTSVLSPKRQHQTDFFNSITVPSNESMGVRVLSGQRLALRLFKGRIFLGARSNEAAFSRTADPCLLFQLL